MRTVLSIDTSGLNKALKEVGAALGPEKMNIALRHTIRDVGRHVRVLTNDEIRKKYKAKKNRISKAIRKPQYTLNGTISCIIPIVDPRGTIATGAGAFRAMKRGPGTEVILGAKAILPHDRRDERIHFYIPSGRLQGHIFVRHDDDVKWIGKRREGTGEIEHWKTKKGKKKKNKKTRITGVRMRKGTVSHGVGITVSQMAMNRASDDIQAQVAEYALQRLLHYQEQILKGNVKR